MNDDAAIAYALAAVLEPATGAQVAFIDVFRAVRKYMRDAYGFDVPLGEVKAVARQAGMRIRKEHDSEYQQAYDVRLKA
ncbi:hypothetical protein ABZU45_09110 [Streptomyces avermitilis]|uniref:hypothetical protein n=1 Tax=Streptomyces avermitilis TaxID=33903 RepID=UPI0033BBF483